MIQTVILVVAVVCSRIVIDWLMNQFRDVPELYLEQQLFAAPTRLENESAIYRSIKCDDPENGVRVGLDIRYDHYKLRHGNLCDVWLLAMGHAASNPAMTVQFGADRFLPFEINSLIHHYRERVAAATFVCIPTNLWLLTAALFAAMMAAFTSGTPVKLYDAEREPDLGGAIHVRQRTVNAHPNTIDAHQLPLDGDPDYVNEYHPDKDRGVALSFAHQVSPSVVSTTDFTPLNLVSATASTLKHLPPQHALGPSDTLLAVVGNDPSTDHVGALVKVLAALVAGSSVCLVGQGASWPELARLKPSIILALAPEFARITADRLGKANPFFVNQLSRGIFWNAHGVGQGIRLVYLQQSVGEPQYLTPCQLNRMRRLLGARIVYERTTSAIAGPIILTDFYDYRVHNAPCRGSGALSQSLEAKLRQVGPDHRGRVFVRGYTIGKGQQRPSLDHHSDMDGFMPLDVMGQWGADGCLYIQ